MRIWRIRYKQYTAECFDLMELLLSIEPNLGHTRLTLTSRYEKGL